MANSCAFIQLCSYRKKLGFYWCDLSESDEKKTTYACRFTHQNILWTFPSPPLSPSPPFLFLCCHILSLSVLLSFACFFPPRVSVSILMSSLSGHFLSFCAILTSFSPSVSPFSVQQSSPFTLLSNSLGHPRVLALFFHLSVSLFLLLPPSLFCSPAAHKNSSFLSPENCSVARGFTAFLDVFSPFLSLSVSLSLCFGSATQPLIHSIFSFVCLTHLYPFKASLCFSSPFS